MIYAKFQTPCSSYSDTGIRTFNIQSTVAAPDKGLKLQSQNVAHKKNESNMILQLQREEATHEQPK